MTHNLIDIKYKSKVAKLPKVLDPPPGNQSYPLDPPGNFFLDSRMTVYDRITVKPVFNFFISGELIIVDDTDFAWCTMWETVNIGAKFSCYNFRIYLSKIERSIIFCFNVQFIWIFRFTPPFLVFRKFSIDCMKDQLPNSHHQQYTLSFHKT